MPLDPRPRAPARGRQFVHRTGERWGLSAADVDRIAAVVVALVRHSVRGVGSAVTIRLSQGPTAVLVEVEDAGIGFEPLPRGGLDEAHLAQLRRAIDAWGYVRLVTGRQIWARVPVGIDR